MQPGAGRFQKAGQTKPVSVFHKNIAYKKSRSILTLYKQV